MYLLTPKQIFQETFIGRIISYYSPHSPNVFPHQEVYDTERVQVNFNLTISTR